MHNIELKLHKILVSIFICSLLFLLIPNVADAIDKTQALQNLESMVNDPEKAREYRRRIKNLSKEELKVFDEVKEVIQNEINTISSSLPMSVDRYTTLESAGTSGSNITYTYTLSNKMPGIEYKGELMSELTTNLKNSMCTSPAGAYLILGYVWLFSYFDENGTYIGGIIIDAKTCGFE